MDIFMGDRDRHRDQWRWASFEKGKPTLWEPISRDHDEAFVNLDGPVLAVTRLYYPPLVAFGDEYPRLYQLNWHAREVDRRFLVELDRGTWDSVATALQRILTDSVIEDAANHMPPEMSAVDSGQLARTLEHRRDSLVSEALEYYAFLSHEVEVRATDAAEVAEVVRTDPEHVELTIRERDKSELYFRRVFDAKETHEVRLKMWGGDDSVVVRGSKGAIALKVVGGGGDDVFADSSGGDHLKFYDDSGQTALASLRDGKVNGKHWNEWIGSDTNRYPPREWGTWWRPITWLTANGDLGLFVGGGFIRTEYGFRRTPYASNMEVRAGYATGAQAFKAEFTGEFHPENSNPILAAPCPRLGHRGSALLRSGQRHAVLGQHRLQPPGAAGVLTGALAGDPAGPAVPGERGPVGRILPYREQRRTVHRDHPGHALRRRQLRTGRRAPRARDG